MKISAQEAPIVDLRLLGSSININEIKDRAQVVSELSHGLKSLGFVNLINHGIPQEKINRAFEISKEYFELAEAAKKKKVYSMNSLHGYVDYENRFVERHGEREHRESYDRAVHKGEYPTEIKDFKPVTDQLVDELVQLTKLLMQLIAEGLGLPLNSFTDAIKDIYTENNNSIFRMLHYPPVVGVEADKTRCGPHTDYDSITLILQDDCGGLKVKNQNNEWIDLKPVPGAVLLNLGELFEIWTGGELKATEHAVTRPTDPQLMARSRYSIAFFVITDRNAIIEPLIGDKEKFQPVDGREYVTKKLKQWYK